ncbi:LOW QUALITY PROTEIN: nuclease SbcCD subunit C-like [Pararge aegeria]|uniref:LOW QUALITY PROTEIN: nuclease SbcCD subunit C-like n=1 Tax=Pararge aegeria TaxID=116150 RepID=UPI0019D2E25C|nr:LOW QUALITY PROTEIN: nuclease SbcCD subunit C-like [Pararge aegeria]
MLAACETGEVFDLLEARDSLEHGAALYAAVREPWLTRALLLYHARTGSARALDLLARAPDLHARHLLDALLEQLRGERAQRALALAALAPLVARRPAWLHRLPAHPLARELLRAAPREREPLPALHALLALAALLPAAPALAAPHWPELADALLRPAALAPPPATAAPATRAHLRLAQLALFHALYAAQPCSLLDALRTDCAAGAAAWLRLAPLLRRVRLHPALVSGSRLAEQEAARRAHDAPDAPDAACAAPPAASPHPPAAPAAPPAAGSGAHAARAAAALRPGAEPWFPLAERCGADSAPNTPLPADADAAEPEAAVEATPENTPAKEPRAAPRAPDSAAVRALGRRDERKEPSPPGDALAARLARVALERRAAESPVAFGGAPPAGALARPEARVAEPPDVEDREVRELTERGCAEPAWAAEEPEARVRDPRAAERGRPRARAAPPPARRAATCSPTARARGSRSVEVQTVDVWPAPYEFLIADFYRNIPDEERIQGDDAEPRGAAPEPCRRLDDYLAALYDGRAPAAPAALAEQLALVHAQLMYERWRREAHAERTRRLLGRCRHARAAELQAAALRERLRAAAAERAALLARAPATPAPPAEPEPRLEAALAAESAARLRAEAALREAEAARAQDAAELRRARGESFEAARHVEALARCALAAERRAEHVRRLRRELLVLAEREARPRAGGAAGAEAARAAGEERALRAALARAEAEAEAQAARAEAAGARAHELEAALAAREAAAAELKRGARAAAEAAAARQRALQDKCAALARAVRAGEARRLERLAGAGGRAAGGGRGRAAQLGRGAGGPRAAGRGVAV